MKKLSLVSLLLAFTMLFTACANGELGLYNAVVKSQDIKSMESSTNVGFKVSTEGFKEEDKMIVDQVVNMLNGYKIKIDQKMIANEEGTKVDAEMKMALTMQDINMEIPMWLKMDLSTDKPEYKQIIKMPKMMVDGMGEEFQGKEYLDYDVLKLMEEQGQAENFKSILTWSKELQPKMKDFLNNDLKNLDTKIKMVENKGKKTVDGEELTIYELKLNDENFKALMKIVADKAVENKELNKFLKEYVNLVMGMSNVSVEEKAVVEAEMKKIEANKDDIKTEMNKFFEAIKGIKILDGEGIVIEYGVNKKGFIVSEAGKMNFILDLANLKENVKELKETEMQGKIKFTVEFDSKIKNINSKDIKVEYPELTEANSIKFSEMMNNMMKFEENEIVDPAIEVKPAVEREILR